MIVLVFIVCTVYKTLSGVLLFIELRMNPAIPELSSRPTHSMIQPTDSGNVDASRTVDLVQMLVVPFYKSADSGKSTDSCYQYSSSSMEYYSLCMVVAHVGVSAGWRSQQLLIDQTKFIIQNNAWILIFITISSFHTRKHYLC